MRTITLNCSLLATLLASALPKHAAAQTYFLSPQSPIAGITLQGTNVLFAVVPPPSQSAPGALGVRSALAAEWSAPTPFASGGYFDAAAGVVSVAPASSAWSPRVYAIGWVGGAAALYSYSVSGTDGSGTFKAIAGTGSVPSNFGRIATAWSAARQSVWIASTSPKGVLSLCELQTAASTSCAWSNVTGTTQLSADGFSPVAIDTTSGDVDVYTVSAANSPLGGGVVQRYRAVSGVWDVVGSPAGTNGGADVTQLQASAIGGQTRVFAAGRGGGKTDSLQMALWNGTAWTWSRLDNVVGGPASIAPAANNIALVPDGGQGDVWVLDGDRNLWRCGLGGSTHCAWTNAGIPSDLRPSSAPLTGPLWGTPLAAFSVGLMLPQSPPSPQVEPQVQVSYGYLYEQNRWWNVLTPASPQVLPSPHNGNSVAEFAADELYGTVVVTGYAGVYSVGVDPKLTPESREFRDGPPC